MDQEKTVRIECRGSGIADISTINAFQGELKDLSVTGYEKLKGVILELGYSEPISVWLDPDKKLQCLNGHQRLRVLTGMREEGYMVPKIPVNLVQAKSLAEAKKKVLSLTSQYGEITEEGLYSFMHDADIELGWVKDATRLPEIDIKHFEASFFTDPGESNGLGFGGIVEKFGAPPFTVLDSRQGYWQDRKRSWVAAGIQSEAGRDENLMKAGEVPETSKTSYSHMAQTTSIFDPVLAELMYKWFSPEGAHILDPFSGGSVRGIVATMSKRLYTGVDIRKEQVAENIRQGEAVCEEGNRPTWIQGDSHNITKLMGKKRFDFLFSCPPYFDLEAYSSLPGDISNQSWDKFCRSYKMIIGDACALLKSDRFACFVVGDIRDKEGRYRDFVGLTVKAFKDAGLELYNEAVLVTPFGTAGMRADRTFSAGRKMIKCHQNVLIFLKGSWKLATKYCGKVELEMLGYDPPAILPEESEGAIATGEEL